MASFSALLEQLLSQASFETIRHSLRELGFWRTTVDQLESLDQARHIAICLLAILARERSKKIKKVLIAKMAPNANKMRRFVQQCQHLTHLSRKLRRLVNSIYPDDSVAELRRRTVTLSQPESMLSVGVPFSINTVPALEQWIKSTNAFRGIVLQSTKIYFTTEGGIITGDIGQARLISCNIHKDIDDQQRRSIQIASWSILWKLFGLCLYSLLHVVKGPLDLASIEADEAVVIFMLSSLGTEAILQQFFGSHRVRAALPLVLTIGGIGTGILSLFLYLRGCIALVITSLVLAIFQFVCTCQMVDGKWLYFMSLRWLCCKKETNPQVN